MDQIQKSPERIAYLDVLRLLATIAVIWLHVTCADFLSFAGDANYYQSLVYDSLSRWCVPVFVMISGALFLRPEKRISLKGLYVKSIGRLVACYVLWALIYYFVFSYDGAFSLGFLLKPHFHLWFLRMLAFVYVLVPVLRLVAVNEKITLYCLIVWMVYLFLGFWGRFDLFMLNPVIGYAGYFLLGYYLSQKTFSKKQVLLACLVGLAGLLVTVFGTYVLSEKGHQANERYFSYLSLNVAVMAMPVFIVVKQWSPKLGKKILGFSDLVRKDLFGVYLTHALWLPLVNTVAFRHWCSPLITIPLITVTVFLLSLALTKLIRLIPGLKKIVE